MNPHDLLSDFDLGPGDPRAALLTIRLFLQHLAYHVYLAEPKLNDATDFVAWLRELAEEARTLARSAQGAPTLELRMEQTPQTPRTGRDQLGQRMIPDRERICHRCGHLHEGVGECGVFMGKSAGFCRCELEVTA